MVPPAGPMPGPSADGAIAPIVKLRLEAATFRALGWLDSKPAFACLALLILIDPVVIWSLDKAREDVQGEKTVVRLIAGTPILCAGKRLIERGIGLSLPVPRNAGIAGANAALARPRFAGDRRPGAPRAMRIARSPHNRTTFSFCKRRP